LALLGVLVIGGIAYGSIPDSSGVVHGCYKQSGPAKGAVLAIDSDAGETCPAGFSPLNWNGRGTYYLVTRTVGIPVGSSSPADAPCGSGVVLGGGYQVSNYIDDVDHRPFVLSSYPVDSHTWRVEALNNGGTDGLTLLVVVHAVCESAG
jgi:hypothetical protein